MTELHSCGCGRCQQEWSSPITSGWRQRQIPEPRAPAVLVDQVTMMMKMMAEDCAICFSAFSWPLLGSAQEVLLGGLSSLRPRDLLQTEERRSVKSGLRRALPSSCWLACLRWGCPLWAVRLKNTLDTHGLCGGHAWWRTEDLLWKSLRLRCDPLLPQHLVKVDKCSRFFLHFICVAQNTRFLHSHS